MKKWWILLLICFSLNGQEEEAQPKAQLRDHSVVLIHGFVSSAQSMMPIRKALTCLGFEQYVWEYPSRDQTIQEHACNLIPMLQYVASCKPGVPINFVTHSVGALVLRCALNLSGCPVEAKEGRIVLIAPPNQGSSLGHRFRNFYPAYLVMGDKSGAQLLNFEARDVACLGNFPDKAQLLVIAGYRGNTLFCAPNDGWITVEETALNTPYQFLSFPVSHGRLLSTAAVFCAIRDFFLR